MSIWPRKPRDASGRFVPKPAGYLSEYESPEEGAISGDVLNTSLGTIPEVIDADFEELDGEEDFNDGATGAVDNKNEQPKAPQPEAPDLEALRIQRDLARLGLDLDRERLGAIRAKQQLEINKARKESIAADKAAFELGQAKRKDIAANAGRAARIFSPNVDKKTRDMLYFGKAAKNLYVPPAPSTDILREPPVKKTLLPQLGRLRHAGSPSAGVTTRIAGTVARPGQATAPIPKDLAQPLQFGLLRKITLPSGTSRLEQAIFAQLQSNQDSDTMDHIKTEVRRLGYRDSVIEQGVRTLEQQGLVEKQKLLGPGSSAVYTVVH